MTESDNPFFAEVSQKINDIWQHIEAEEFYEDVHLLVQNERLAQLLVGRLAGTKQSIQVTLTCGIQYTGLIKETAPDCLLLANLDSPRVQYLLIVSAIERVQPTPQLARPDLVKKPSLVNSLLALCGERIVCVLDDGVRVQGELIQIFKDCFDINTFDNGGLQPLTIMLSKLQAIEFIGKYRPRRN